MAPVRACSRYSASPIEVAFGQVNNVDEDDFEENVPEPMLVEQPSLLEAGENSARKRSLQQVVTLQAKCRVVKWMIDDEQVHEKKGLMSRCVLKFSEHFCGTVNANCMKATRWWDEREKFLNLQQDKETKLSVNHSQPGINRKVLLKAAPARGKRSSWVTWLYRELEEEFDHLRKAGVKFLPKLLRQLALELIETSNHPQFCSSYEEEGKLISVKVTDRWIQHFMANRNIVGPAQTGSSSAFKQELLSFSKGPRNSSTSWSNALSLLSIFIRRTLSSRARTKILSTALSLSILLLSRSQPHQDL
ncbi:hypothetical protein R1sor_020251 [Riccia sorocarpa]|uniref:HTH CENPB-type domain-containing protein n=1 Tax=Riccia sorocarpa TaxID=122646 RepID=A0ABD3IL35_9MARC